MNSILTPEVVSLIITGVIVPFAIKAINIGAIYIEHKINDNRYNKYINAAVIAVDDAVNAVAQTYVDNLKKAGTWTPETETEALNMAKSKAVSLMGADVQGFINTTFGSLESWLDTKIESYVKKNK